MKEENRSESKGESIKTQKLGIPKYLFFSLYHFFSLHRSFSSLLTFSIFAFLFFFFTSQLQRCSSGESERSRGIRLADEGKWDEAIELLEKYLNENPKPFVVQEIDKISEFYNLKNQKEVKEYLETVLYLTASYLGKSGFDIRELLDPIQEVAKLSEDQDLERKTSEIIRNRIFSGLEDSVIRQRIFYIYKAQRLIEKTLYGEEGKIDKVYSASGTRTGKEIPNLGENQVDLKSQKELFEIKRLINTLEYIAGKVLIWKSVLISAYLRHFDFFLKKEEEREGKPLPSLCCELQEKYPYLITQHNIYQITFDVSAGIDYLRYGLFSEIDFSEFATRYGDIAGEIKSNLDKRAERVCRIASEEFKDTITNIIYKEFERIVTDVFNNGATIGDYVSELTVNAQVSERKDENDEIKVSEKGIWICPREISKAVREIQAEFLCGREDEVRENVKDKIISRIQVFGDGATFQIAFRYPDGKYLNCEGKEVLDTTRTITAVIRFKDGISDNDADEVREEICGKKDIKDLRTQTEEFIKDPLGSSNKIGELIKLNKIIEEAIKDLFAQREDPRECSYQ